MNSDALSPNPSFQARFPRIHRFATALLPLTCCAAAMWLTACSGNVIKPIVLFEYTWTQPTGRAGNPAQKPAGDTNPKPGNSRSCGFLGLWF